MNNQVRERLFMAEYVWTTLLALYRRLNLKKFIKLRNVDSDIVLPSEISDALVLPVMIHELMDALNSILKRMHQLFTREFIVSQGPVHGKVQFNKLGKYYPQAVPLSVTKHTIKTPSNLLAAATIIEVENRLRTIRSWLIRLPATEVMRIFRDRIIELLDNSLALCGYMASEPIIKLLIHEASVIAKLPHELSKLERNVCEEVLLKPKEMSAYMKLLEFREKLKQQLILVEKAVKELPKILSLKLEDSKLYELYGFTLILETLLEVVRFDGRWQANISPDERILYLRGPVFNIAISYNAVPDDMESRIQHAVAYGIIDGPIETSKLKGIPDTIVCIEDEESRRRIVVDYKYTRSYNYLVQSRFKVFSYLYEYNADAAILVAPSPANLKEREELDEEVSEGMKFYSRLVDHGGAIIELSNDARKLLAISFIEPSREQVSRNKEILRNTLRILLGNFN